MPGAQAPVVECDGQYPADHGGGEVGPPVGEPAGQDHRPDGPGGIDSPAADRSADDDGGGKRGPDGQGGQAGRDPLVGSHGNDDQHQDEGYDALSREYLPGGHPGGREGSTEAGHGLGPLAVQAPGDGGGGDRPDELRSDVGHRVRPREPGSGG